VADPNLGVFSSRQKGISCHRFVGAATIRIENRCGVSLDESHRPEVHILGVQPGRLGPGLNLSPDVAAALPRVLEAARRIMAAFGR